jgi:RNA polymerase sigma-70 factor (ECF subfamily)
MRYPTKKTEQHQLEKIHAGKETAIAEFLNQHKDQLFYAAYLLVKDRYLAEDIFQEACIRVIKSIRKGNYAEEGKLLPWVARIVRNLSIDYLRQAKKRIKVTLPNGEDIFSILDSGRKNHEEIMEQKQSCKTVREVLNQIPFKQREVVVMRIYGEMSFKDIAHLQGSSLNTVLGRMRYGLINMKKLIKEKNIVL